MQTYATGPYTAAGTGCAHASERTYATGAHARQGEKQTQVANLRYRIIHGSGHRLRARLRANLRYWRSCTARKEADAGRKPTLPDHTRQRAQVARTSLCGPMPLALMHGRVRSGRRLQTYATGPYTAAGTGCAHVSVRTYGTGAHARQGEKRTQVANLRYRTIRGSGHRLQTYATGSPSRKCRLLEPLATRLRCVRLVRSQAWHPRRTPDRRLLGAAAGLDCAPGLGGPAPARGFPDRAGPGTPYRWE